MLPGVYVSLILVLLSTYAAQYSTSASDVSLTQQDSSCNCLKQHTAGPLPRDVVSSSASLLTAAASDSRKHVLMKVRMLPTAASALLKTVRAGRLAHQTPAANSPHTAVCYYSREASPYCAEQMPRLSPSAPYDHNIDGKPGRILACNHH
jgi:hypothetical protein